MNKIQGKYRRKTAIFSSHLDLLEFFFNNQSNY